MRKIYRIFFIISLIGCEKSTEPQFLLKKLSNERTGVNFVNEIKDDSKHNIVSYLYYYNGGGVAIGDVNNDNLPDIYFTSNKQKNKLYLNKGNLQFEDITLSAMVGGTSDWNTGVTMVDINSDGHLDIYVCSVTGLLDFKGKNELFINNGDGTFTEKAKDYGLDYEGYATQSYFFDYDKDNDLDVYIVNHAVHTKTSHGPALLRKKRSSLVGDVLLQNNNGKFTDVSKEAKIFGGVNGYGLSASLADFNNDGWDDIYVSNDFHEDDYYYLNNGDGTFSESFSKSFSVTSRFSMGSDASDINADGYQDLITLDMLPQEEKILKESEGDVTYNVQGFLTNLGYQKQYSRNMLQMNSKGENFIEAGLYNNISATDWSWSPLLADFDQDGYQDLFVSNGIYKRPNNLDFMRYIASSFKNRRYAKGKDQWLINSLKEMPEGKVPNQIFQGNAKKFKPQNGNWIDNKPSLSNGAIYSDLDLDGDLDIVVNNLNEVASIYENQTNGSKNYLNIQFKYIGKNIKGIGSKVILYSNQQKQTKQLFNSRGFISSKESKLFFGLDTINKVDSLRVIWPENTSIGLTNPKINQTLTIDYATIKPEKYIYNKRIKKIFKTEKFVNYVHSEDRYNDFDNEKLIPYKVSTIGPAIAIGDINNDGWKDIFIGGSSENKAQIFTNNGEKISPLKNLDIESDVNFEDNDAAFIDADNDGDLDLYVASGINANRKIEFEIDRFYLNNGNGLFKKTSNRIPQNPNNTSCVKAHDFDKDGDIDLFIGNRSNPSSFGDPVESFILENDGKGNFTKNSDFSLKALVTDAVWRDVNKDGAADLLISTEWDQPKIYINNNGSFSEQKIAKNTNGLWQTIETYDIDNDGDQDILLGNWGENTKFQPSKETPLLMYYSDFDNNNKKETVLAYKVGDNYYPVNSKDELASQINIMSKRFVKYASYANTPIETVLTKESINKAQKYYVDNLSSGYLLNEGGQFLTYKKFPQNLQLSTIMSFHITSFDDEMNPEVLVSGNFNDLNTYHGIFSSLENYIISNKKEEKYYNASQIGLNTFKKQIREVRTLKLKNKELLFMVSNQDSLKVFSH